MRFPCEFGTYPFSGSRDILYTIANKKLQDAKDVLPNINCMQAVERAKMLFFVPGDLDL